MNPIIKLENISKLYRLGSVGTNTFKEDIHNFYSKLIHKTNPVNINKNSGLIMDSIKSNHIWSLKDINFELNQGDVLGIIGKNGAGKSTLLKILSRVTAPTTGKIKVKGRIASLLEVGTGFHPELTGKENIYLNGAILGMKKNEITRKLDEIISFSGVEKFINTPVKRYSSGMYVRLAFAVAAHLESEILIVDEILSVGDLDFQNKCIGKMGDISKTDGRTILYVSHNIASVNLLCNKGLFLNKGELIIEGKTKIVIDAYLSSVNNSRKSYNSEENKINQINTASVLNIQNILTNVFYFNEEIHLNINFSLEEIYVNTSCIGIRVVDQKERVVFSSNSLVSNFIYNNTKNNYSVKCIIPNDVLVPNNYRITIALHIPNKEIIDLVEDAVNFTIEETGSLFHMYNGNDYGCVFVGCKWLNS